MIDIPFFIALQLELKVRALFLNSFVSGVDDLELKLLFRASDHNALQLRVTDFTQTTPCPFLDNKMDRCDDLWVQLSHIVAQSRFVEHFSSAPTNNYGHIIFFSIPIQASQT